MNKNYLIYSRLSLAAKDPITGLLDVENVAWQEDECRAWIEADGDHVVGVIRENSKSAYVEWKRTKFNGIIAQAKAHETKADGVVSYALDRLTRHPVEMEALIELAKDHDFITKTLDGQFDLTTELGRHYARGAVNNFRFEVEKKSKRHKDGNQRRLDTGRPPQGGGRPFGFEADKVTIRPCEAEAIKDVTERFLAGASVRTLVREWNEAEILTVRGAQWTRGTLLLLLKRWRNAGLREHDGEPVAPAVWPAIVTRDQVEAVRHLLASRAVGPRYVTRKHLLTGIAVCGLCGSPVTADSTMHNGKRYAAYRCRGGVNQKVCGLSVRQDVVDEKVLEQASKWLALPTSNLVDREGTRRGTELRTERTEILVKMEEFKTRDFTAEFAKIMSDASKFQDRLKAIDAELARLAENDVLDDVLADVRAALLPVPESVLLPGPVSFELSPVHRANRQTARDLLDKMRTDDLTKLRRLLRSLLLVELMRWTGSGKPNADTARQRVQISEAAHPAYWVAA